MITFNLPITIFIITGLIVLFYCFASATMYASTGKKFDEIGNPYEKFLLTRMLKLTRNDTANVILYSLFIIVLWPFHAILITLGYFYNS